MRQGLFSEDPKGLIELNIKQALIEESEKENGALIIRGKKVVIENTGFTILKKKDNLLRIECKNQPLVEVLKGLLSGDVFSEQSYTGYYFSEDRSALEVHPRIFGTMILDHTGSDISEALEQCGFVLDPKSRAARSKIAADGIAPTSREYTDFHCTRPRPLQQQGCVIS